MFPYLAENFAENAPAPPPNIFYEPMRNCLSHKINGRLRRNGAIGLAPKNDPIIQVLSNYIQYWNYKTVFFNTNDEINNYILSNDYGQTSPYLCFAVFMNHTGNNYNYALRFNTTGNPTLNVVPDT